MDTILFALMFVFLLVFLSRVLPKNEANSSEDLLPKRSPATFPLRTSLPPAAASSPVSSPASSLGSRLHSFSYRGMTELAINISEFEETSMNLINVKLEEKRNELGVQEVHGTTSGKWETQDLLLASNKILDGYLL